MLYTILLAAALQTATPAPPPDPKIETLANDLRAISRVAALSPNLGDTRPVMLAIIDADVESLREKRDDGTYRWASLQREEASRVTDEKTIERVHSEQELRKVTVTAPNAYRVEVRVPQKRNLVSANNRVFVRNVLVDITGFDGKMTHHDLPVNAWVNPGDSTGVALPAIGKSVTTTVELGVESGEKRAVAEVGLVQAKLVDDPASPHFPAVRRLLQVRNFAAERDINRGNLKTAADEALLALPGELEKRNAEIAAAAARRKQENAGVMPGDATPDVVVALQEVSRLLGGTLADQSAAREKLQRLIETLQPKPQE